MAEITISNQVYLKLKADIVCGKYEYDHDLPSIMELCRVFQVGRNTMRHALKQLQQEGFIHQEKGRNARILFNLNMRENRKMYEEMLWGRLPSIIEVFEIMEYILPGIAQEAINNASDEDIAHLFEMTNALKKQQFTTSQSLMNAVMEIYTYAFSLLHNPFISSLFEQMMDFILVAIPDYSMRKKEFQKNMNFVGNMIAVILKAIIKKDSILMQKTVKYLIHNIAKKTQSYIRRVVDEDIVFHPITFHWFYEKEVLYQKVVINILKDIHLGLYQNEKELPSLEQLAKEHHVSLRTSRKAMEVLKEYGFVKTINGIGSFVDTQAFKKDEWIHHPEIKANLKEFINALYAIYLCLKGFGYIFLKKLSDEQIDQLVDTLEHQNRKIITPVVKLLFQQNTCSADIYEELDKQLVWLMYVDYFYSFDDEENQYYEYYDQLLKHLKAHQKKKAYDVMCETMWFSVTFVRNIYENIVK